MIEMDLPTIKNTRLEDELLRRAQEHADNNGNPIGIGAGYLESARLAASYTTILQNRVEVLEAYVQSVLDFMGTGDGGSCLSLELYEQATALGLIPMISPRKAPLS